MENYLKLFVFTLIVFLCDAQIENPCSIDTPHKTFLHPTDPQKYIQCSTQGTMFIRECPPRLRFSIEKQRCDRRQAGSTDPAPALSPVQTTPRTTTKTTTTTPFAIPEFSPITLATKNAARINTAQAINNTRKKIPKFSPATTTTAKQVPLFPEAIPAFNSEPIQDAFNSEPIQETADVIPPLSDQFETTTTRTVPTRPRATLTTKTTTTTAQPQLVDTVQRTPGEVCNFIQISGSKMGMVNGVYVRLQHNDATDLPMYERLTGVRRTVIVPLSDMWCISLSFGLFATSDLSPSVVEGHCQTRQCCLLVSDLDGKDLTDPTRDWLTNNIVNGGEDSSLQISCSSQQSAQVSTPKSARTTTQKIATVAARIETESLDTLQTNDAPSIESVLDMERVNSLINTFRFIPINTCKMVSCGENARCASRKSCPKCNPACFPNGDLATENMVKITCSNVACPSGSRCALDENDNSLKCVL